MRRYKTKEGQQLIYESKERLLASWNVAWTEQDAINACSMRNRLAPAH
ncbi:hypothetical protein ABU162_23540 [Paenibacillus thiaminolyticus]